MVKSYRVLTGVGTYMILGTVYKLDKKVYINYDVIFLDFKNYSNSYNDSDVEALKTFEYLFNTNLGLLFTSIIFFGYNIFCSKLFIKK